MLCCVAVALIFNCFDADGDGFISNTELTTYFSSYLSALLALSSCTVGTPQAAIRDIVRRAAYEAAGRFLYAADKDNDGQISYDEFTEVIDRFPSLVPWIGILHDPEEDDAAAAEAEAAAEAAPAQKPPAARDEKQSAAPRTDRQKAQGSASAAAAADSDIDSSHEHDQSFGDHSNDDGLDEEDETDPNAILYSLPLTEDRSLELRQDDLDSLNLLQQTIGSASTQRLIEVFSRFMDANGLLDREAFARACEYLVPTQPPLPEARRRLLQFLLATTFSLFDEDGSGKIDCKEFLAGAVSLSNLEKDQRLAIAFMIVDVDNDGQLSRSEIIDFVSSFLRVLLGVSQSAREAWGSSPDEISGIVAQAAAAQTDELFAVADTDHDHYISWPEFQAVINKHPTLVPWVSLFDTLGQRSKTQLKRRAKIAARREWKLRRKQEKAAARAAASARSGATDFADHKHGVRSPTSIQSTGAGATGGVASTPRGGVLTYQPKSGGSGSGSGGRSTVTIPLTQSGAQLKIDTDDVAERLALLRESLFDRMTTDELLRVFNDQARAGVLNKAGFERAVAKLIPRGSSLSSEHQHMLRYLLGQCFIAFDSDRSGGVDAHEFVAGLNLLCGRNDPAVIKQKLALSFKMIDTNRDQYLDRSEMSEFLGSFLRVVMVLNGTVSDQKPERIQSLINTAVREANTVFFAAADTNGDGKVSFHEFCDLHHDKPHLIPWLSVLQNIKPAFLTAHLTQTHLAREAAHAAVAHAAAHTARDHQLKAGVASHSELANAAAGLGRERLAWIGGDGSAITPAPHIALNLPAGVDPKRAVIIERLQSGGEKSGGSVGATHGSSDRASAPAAPAPEIKVTNADVSNFSFLRRVFKHVTSEQLMHTFAEYAQVPNTTTTGSAGSGGEIEGEGVLDRAGFLKCITALLSSPAGTASTADLTANHRQLLFYLLSRTFDLFDRDKNSVIDFAEFMTAMNTLASNDSQKTLALAFMLADADANGYLSPAEFENFLSSFMRMVLAINSTFAASPAAELQSLVDQNVSLATREAFKIADVNNDGRISFDEFKKVVRTHPELGMFCAALVVCLWWWCVGFSTHCDICVM